MQRSKTIGTALAVVTMMAGTADASAKEGRHRAIPVEGTYAQVASCIPTGGAPGPTPTTPSFQCATGTTTWFGDLEGPTRLSGVQGRYSDVVAGEGSGSGHETLLATNGFGLRGTLEMHAVFSFSGLGFEATNTILSGTGELAGARGTLHFTGSLFGTGTYSGVLRLPRRGR